MAAAGIAARVLLLGHRLGQMIGLAAALATETLAALFDEQCRDAERSDQVCPPETERRIQRDAAEPDDG